MPAQKCETWRDFLCGKPRELECRRPLALRVPLPHHSQCSAFAPAFSLFPFLPGRALDFSSTTLVASCATWLSASQLPRPAPLSISQTVAETLNPRLRVTSGNSRSGQSFFPSFYLFLQLRIRWDVLQIIGEKRSNVF